MNKIKTESYIGKRIIAAFVDYAIIYGFFFIMAYGMGKAIEGGGYQLTGLKAFIPIIFWLIMTVGCEQMLGATLGNSLVGLKPVSILEKKEWQTFKNIEPTFGQSLKRHLLDPIDMTFIGLIAIMISENNQRLGDKWAKTVVIKLQGE